MMIKQGIQKMIYSKVELFANFKRFVFYIKPLSKYVNHFLKYI